ncbi:MAG: apolipoprotein N-acyltransferase [Alphaproteobacteria bacterium]
MLSKSTFYLNFFSWGFLTGISTNNIILVPFFILGFYKFIHNIQKLNSPLSGFQLGWLFGFGFFLSSMYWIVNPFLIYEKHLFLAPIVIILFPILLGIFFGIAGFFILIFISINKINESTYLKCFAISISLFFSEYLRSFIFGGLPFNLAAHIWAYDERFLKIISFVGVYGLSFLTFYWLTFLGLSKIKWSFKSLFSLILFPIILFSISFLSSDSNLKEPDEVKIRIVQPNISQKQKWDKTLFQNHIDKLIRLSTEDMEESHLIVIWPEVALTVYLNEQKELIEYIKERIGKNVVLITGGLRRVFDGSNVKIFNSLFLIHQDQVVVYDKTRLVPFGEYIPFRSFLKFLKITPGDIDFSRGELQESLEIRYRDNLLKFEPSICYEAIFQTFNYSNIELFINITNDAWFGNLSGPRQHLTASIMRSIEKGVPLVRAANSGVSVITDKNGKILEKLNLNNEGFIETKVASEIGNTPFLIFGKKILLLEILIIFIISILLDFFIKKRKDLKF